jgi:adenosylcobinamide kinase / adenosylcobinamide-phosphate guanylyltransferase
MSLTFLLGGTRSGKSSLAVELARAWTGPVTFIATGEPGDEEMAERIRLHQGERPAEWQTVEAPLDVREALELVPDEAAVVLDCLSLWVANLLERGDSADEIGLESRAVSALAAARPSLTVAVSNEVGLGVVPSTELGRRYRDVLGRVNARWAADAEHAAFVVAGRSLPLS